MSRIGFLSAFPMGCPSKSLTHDVTVPETMSFPFGKTTSAPMYVSCVMGVGSSFQHYFAWEIPFPSSCSYNSYSEVEFPPQCPVCLLMIPALSTSFDHMILYSFSILVYLAHLQLNACMMICSQLS